jgi:hypothetical protein
MKQQYSRCIAMPGHGRLLMTLLLFAGISCDGPSCTIPAVEPDIVGTVTSIEQMTMRVEERPDESSGSAKADVLLTDESCLLLQDGSIASRAELTRGRKVRVWFTGPVMESYPLRTTAGTIVIVTK